MKIGRRIGSAARQREPMRKETDMASSLEFVQFACDQMSEAGEITYRKMFGEYGLYCDGKFFAVICDDQLFIKVTEAGSELAPELPLGPPYEGAKPHFIIEDLEDRAFLTAFVRRTAEALPLPKPRKKKVKKEN